MILRARAEEACRRRLSVFDESEGGIQYIAAELALHHRTKRTDLR